MGITNIDNVLHGMTVEWECIEFKQEWNPLEVMHTFCAFANDFNNLGGAIYLLELLQRPFESDAE